MCVADLIFETKILQLPRIGIRLHPTIEYIRLSLPPDSRQNTRSQTADRLYPYDKHFLTSGNEDFDLTNPHQTSRK